MLADNARDDTIPEPPTQSIAGPWHELQQGQDLDDVINPTIRGESRSRSTFHDAISSSFPPQLPTATQRQPV